MELQAVVYFFSLCWSCRHELSVMGCPIWVQSTSVHQNSAESLGVRQCGVGETLAMLCSSAALSPTHRSSWTASRRKVSSVLPEENSRALALIATAMDYIYLFMYCTINLLFMDYRHAAKSHGKRSCFYEFILYFNKRFKNTPIKKTQDQVVKIVFLTADTECMRIFACMSIHMPITFICIKLNLYVNY